MMITEAIINLGLIVETCLSLTIYLTKFVFKYKHKYESNPLCTSTVLFCSLVVLLTSFVLPVDIFLVSFIKNQDGTFKEWATKETLSRIDTIMYTSYTSLYAMIIILTSLVIPFLHFFNEETESNSRDRLHNAVKLTFAILLLILIISFGGAFINGNIEPNTVFEKILPTHLTKPQGAILLVITIISLLGFINVSFYTASGLFSWPIGLIFGTSSISARCETVSDQSDLLRIRVNALREKARTQRLSSREQEQLDQAEESVRRLDREETVLNSHSSSLAYKMRKVIRPLQILVGILFAMISLILLVSLIMVNVDRILHSPGPREGYVLLNPVLFNPFEYVCTKLQDLIFIGPIPLLLVTSFLVVASISGIRNLGLWFAFARLHRIKVGRTPPQALLFFCMTMMLAVSALNLILYSLAPQYVTFGNQNFRLPGTNGTYTVQTCTIGQYHPDCRITKSSELIMRMMTQVWVFGTLFYWWSWTFVLVAFISIIAYLKRGKRQPAHDILVDEDEFEE